jgi:hypothetical protein
MSAREEVLEDVLQRIAEERGVETMALGWEILDQILENDEASYGRSLRIRTFSCRYNYIGG